MDSISNDQPTHHPYVIVSLKLCNIYCNVILFHRCLEQYARNCLSMAILSRCSTIDYDILADNTANLKVIMCHHFQNQKYVLAV